MSTAQAHSKTNSKEHYLGQTQEAIQKG